MAQLTDNQIAQLAHDAGVSGGNLPIAVAIALAESGGNTDAINHNSNGSVDVGVWQINSSNWSAMGWHGQQDGMDPKKNAKAMGVLSFFGASWRPWTTYTNGAYKQYLPRGQAAAKNYPTGPGGLVDSAGNAINNAANGIAAPFESVAKAISFIFSFQFLYVVAGGVLLIAALLLIAHHTGIDRQVASVAAKVK